MKRKTLKPARLGAPRAILEELTPGPLKVADLIARARQIAGNPHNADVALGRLRDAGLITTTVKLTPAGRKVLAPGKATA